MPEWKSNIRAEEPLSYLIQFVEIIPEMEEHADDKIYWNTPKKASALKFLYHLHLFCLLLSSVWFKKPLWSLVKYYEYVSEVCDRFSPQEADGVAGETVV